MHIARWRNLPGSLPVDGVIPMAPVFAFDTTPLPIRPEDSVQVDSTRLYRPGRGHVDITPGKGSALFFRHGFGPHSVLHEGSRVVGDVSKYLARINVMYARA